MKRRRSHDCLLFLLGNDAFPLILIDIYQNNSKSFKISDILLYKTKKLLYLCTVIQNKHKHYDTKR